jgi:hypothetical protein
VSTRATLRTTIRAELNDSGGTPLWAMALLDRWIADAILAWSRDVPREQTWSQTTTANQGAYALPADWMAGVRVEHPSGFYRARVPFAGGDVDPGALVTIDPTVKPGGLLWDVWAGELVLSPAPDASGQTILVRYLAQYTAVADDVTNLDVPAAEESALVWWVCARALEWVGMDEAKRQRFERQRGADPLSVQQAYERRYTQMVRERNRGVRQRRAVVRE